VLKHCLVLYVINNISEEYVASIVSIRVSLSSLEMAKAPSSKHPYLANKDTIQKYPHKNYPTYNYMTVYKWLFVL
jgi:hypothetical protein